MRYNASMRDVSRELAQRYVLLCGDALGARERAIMEHDDVLAVSAPGLPGHILFVAPGAACVIRRATATVVARESACALV